MIVLSGNVSFEFLGTLRSADGSAVISHNLRIGMHHRECFAMSITPSVKSKRGVSIISGCDTFTVAFVGRMASG